VGCGGKGNMGMKKRIKEEVDAKMIRKQTFTKKITNNIPNNHFVKKGGKHPKLRLSRRANHGGWGEEHNKAKQSKARTIFLLEMYCATILIEISWSAFFRKLFELICYVPNLLTTTHKLILREKVGAEKVVFLGVAKPIISGD
jgi:hypothetical protein